MSQTKAFSGTSGKEIEAVIKGKTISGFETSDEGMHDWIIIRFTDDSEFRLRYDWIYEWTA